TGERLAWNRPRGNCGPEWPIAWAEDISSSALFCSPEFAAQAGRNANPAAAKKRTSAKTSDKGAGMDVSLTEVVVGGTCRQGDPCRDGAKSRRTESRRRHAVPGHRARGRKP